jgi:hypothetical protein
MRRIMIAASALIVGCGGGTPGAPTPDGSVYQNARGFCAEHPRLSGGDLVGTWTVVGACAISTNAPDSCAGATVNLSLAGQGSITFNADQTGSIDVSVTLKKESTVPSSCPSAGDCTSLERALAIEVGTGAGASAACSISSAGSTSCSCEQNYPAHPFQGSGSYQLQLPNYLVSPSLHLQGGFLVQGNTLRVGGVAVEGTQLDLIAQR